MPRGRSLVLRSRRIAGVRSSSNVIRAARFVYQNRQRFRQAARVIGRAGRAYLNRKKTMRENFSPRNIGKDFGTADCKKTNTTNINGLGQINSRELYVYDLMQIPPGYFDNQREGATVNVSGVKICSEWLCLQGATTNGLNVHIALVSPKDSNAKFDRATIKVDFFGAMGMNGSNRAVDFSNNLSSNDFRCMPINTDKWVVLRHFRFRLWPNSSVGALGCYKSRDFYVKLKRQIQWSSSAPDATSDSPLFLLYWCDDFINPAGSGGIVDALQHQIKSTLYFRDPK